MSNDSDSEPVTKYAPDYDGPTYNARPVVSHTGTHADLRVECHRHDPTVHESCRADCRWTGTASELVRGKPKMGSQPRDLLCPECKWRVAAERNTTGAGYWAGRIP